MNDREDFPLTPKSPAAVMPALLVPDAAPMSLHARAHVRRALEALAGLGLDAKILRQAKATIPVADRTQHDRIGLAVRAVREAIVALEAALK